MRNRVTLVFMLLASMNSATLAWAPLQLRSPHSIRGLVHDSFCRPVSGVTICASPEVNPTAAGVGCGKSDSEGRFVIGLNRPGRYRLNTAEEGHVGQRLPFYKDPAAPIPEITLIDLDTDSLVSLTIGPKNGVLTGSAIDATTGLPIDDISLVQCHVDNPQICFSQSAKSGDGRFSIYAPHVPFTLKITAAGYEEWFGLSGSGRREPIHIGSGDTTELSVSLKRRDDSAKNPLHEAEKQVGVNLQPPVQLSPEADARFKHYPRLTKLEWAPVEGAAKYTVEVDYCRGGERKDATACVSPQPLKIQVNPSTLITATTYEFTFIGSQPGRWRVWAVDKEGREGFKSGWRKFFYLR